MKTCLLRTKTAVVTPARNPGVTGRRKGGGCAESVFNLLDAGETSPRALLVVLRADLNMMGDSCVVHGVSSALSL